MIMMTIEKRLALTDLTQYKQLNAKNQLDELAKNIVKYQNFKTKVALQYLGSHFSENTLKTYFAKGVQYIKYGTRNKKIKSLYESIDAVLASKLQPLTPSKEDKANTCPPRLPKKITKPIETQTTETFSYAIQSGKHIRIIDSETDWIEFKNLMEFFKIEHNCRFIHFKEV